MEIVIAWCEKRNAIRHFRSDRILDLKTLDARYPRSRTALLRQWQKQEGIPPD